MEHCFDWLRFNGSLYACVSVCVTVCVCVYLGTVSDVQSECWSLFIGYRYHIDLILCTNLFLCWPIFILFSMLCRGASYYAVASLSLSLCILLAIIISLACRCLPDIRGAHGRNDIG